MTNDTLPEAPIWRFFDDITRIPRASKHEERMVDYIVEFARRRSLPVRQDRVGNVLVTVDATPGLEQLQPIILQAHLDMVCEKNTGVTVDFCKDAIPYYILDGWVRSRGTTLGADDGIGVAAALAVMDEGLKGNLPHCPLHCLFTVDEETGLTGANNIRPEFLPANMLINLDSEDEGQVFIGCAGGCTTTASFDLAFMPTPANTLGVKIALTGLLGGHSGSDIHLGRGNAVQILARFIEIAVQKCDLHITSFDGGHLRNAIPREAVCVGIVPMEQKETLRVELNCFLADVERELLGIETGIKLDLETVPVPQQVMQPSLQQRLLTVLTTCPHGVVAMSQPDNTVQTSTNLASVTTHADAVEIVTSQRSALPSDLYRAHSMVHSIFSMAKANVLSSDGYPAWTPKPTSTLVVRAREAYMELFGKKPLELTIHAGLECALFAAIRPQLQMISIGPTIRDVHSPDEALEIASVDRFWLLLAHLIAH